jgi:tetratricopeptide (TPR) repeat protein
VFVIALAVVLASTPPRATGWTEREATRETMQTIFDSLRFLLRLDAAGENLDDPKYRSQVLEALRELDDQSAILAAHGFYEDTGGMYLASVLERYTVLLLKTYERGEPEQVQQLLYGITDICIACHSRLPSPQDSPVAAQFIDTQEFASLPAWKRARLQVATRRFDDALNTLETLIESAKSVDPASMEDPLRTYLIVNIRVKGDMERPIATLEQLSERAEAGSEWRRDVEVWTQSLEHLRDRPFIGDPLASARAMLDSAGSAIFPSPRSARVEYIAASSLLHRYLVSRPSEALQVSEAHYLLGLAEYRIHPHEWLPNAELYLEIAIVLAPQAPWAKSAYALLVAKINESYRWSGKGALPPEVEQRLRELKQAIDGGQPANAGSAIQPPAALG